MHELIVSAGRCLSCGAASSSLDRFCRNCGAPLSGAHLEAAAHSGLLVNRRERGKFWDNRLAVFGLLLAVGPLGLPFLWISSRFSPMAKIATTVVYFALTVIAPLAVAWYWLDFAVRPLVQALSRRL